MAYIGRLRGRTCLVVYVGSELARASAVRFANEGAELIVTDPFLDVAEAVGAEIRANGGKCTSLQADLGSEIAITRVADCCDQTWDHLDVLMIGGGSLDWWSYADDSMEKWEEVIRTNLLMPAFYTKALRRLLC